MRRKWFGLSGLLGAGLLGAAVFAGSVGAVTGSGVQPTFVNGNPSCTDLGYDYGFKPAGSGIGTHTVAGVGSFTVTGTGVDGVIDWTSTFGIDAFIVKGGPNANVYVYDPPAESFGDTNLSTPINNENGKPYGLSHVEVCYDFEVAVSKTAATSFTRTYEWDIEKTVTPATWNLFSGDSGTSDYEVAVTKTGYTDSDWAVSGTIKIENPAPVAATITSVSDSISDFGAVTVDCGVSFPYELASGGQLWCTYSTELPNGTDRVNTATVATSGAVGGGSDTADVTFGDPTTEVNATVNVTDSVEGDLGSTSTGTTFEYSRTFACDDDEGENPNTATIDETEQSDDATVTVNCYELSVTKDADTELTRTWDWTIDKSADQSDLLLSDGQLFTVNYEVEVDASSADSGWAVSGSISVANPAPIDATINGVGDVISGAINASVDCGVTFPYILVAGGTLNCTYSADLPDGADRTNTATATLQNTPSGTTDFTGTAAVSFADADVTEIDECIDVTDTNVGVLGTVCAADAPRTFNYSLDFGAHADADVQLLCGDNEHTNIASFVTNDTGSTGSDNWVVSATIACDFGCTLTQGYWKTHSEFGPAPYDDTWMQLSNGASTLFFSSGQTWYQVFWTSPAGNAYYNLAHQYMAAYLSILNGASSTAAVDAAIAGAEALFAAQGAGDTTLTRAERTLALGYASTLDQFNNGLIGPGHCSE